MFYFYHQSSASTASIGEANVPTRPLTNNLPDVLPTQQQVKVWQVGGVVSDRERVRVIVNNFLNNSLKESYVTFSLRALCFVFVMNVMLRFRYERYVTFSPNVLIILFIPDYILIFRNRQNLLIVESPQMNPSRHHLWPKTLKKKGSSLNNAALALVGHPKLLQRCPWTWRLTGLQMLIWMRWQ